MASPNAPEEEQPNSLPIASISLSISTILPSHFIPPKPLTTIPHKIKIPSQISTLSHFSLTSSLPPPKSFSKTSISSTPLHSTLSLNPLRPSNPSGAAALRRAAVVWFRNDLRIHDNECLTTANNESLSLLPVYCFDPRDYGKSYSGFDKTGPFRATFLVESVSNLRENLKARGSNLVVRIGKPENVLLEMVKAVGAEAVYMHKEVSNGEVKEEERIGEVMKDEGVEVKYFWGSTLYHLEDLPFELEDIPTNYGGFKDKVKRLEVRKTIEGLDRIKDLPRKGNVEPGDIPTLMDLGLNPNAAAAATTMPPNGTTAANASLVGGETEALQRLRNFAADCKAKLNNGNKDATSDTIYGTNFSCKISPWLAMGCLSPRTMFDEIKKSASNMMSDKKNGGESSTVNWLMYELLWRDFFRFITRKYSSAKQHTYAPATGCAA